MDKSPAGRLVRGTSQDASVRVLAAVTTPCVEEARRRHDLWPTAAAAVGRALTAAALMAEDLKVPGAVVIRFRGDGPLGGLVAEGRRPERAGDPIEVRGYAHEPHVDLDLNARGKLDVGRAVGRGTLYVVRDEFTGEPYTGTAAIVTGEIGEDLAHYFLQSEQRRTAVALGVLVDPDGSVRAAGGAIVEVLPGAGEETVARLEDNIARLGGVSRFVDRGGDADAIAAAVLGDLGFRRLAERPVVFRCRCSRERLAAALVALGEAELDSMAREDGGAELRCRFCGAVYRFDVAELEALRADARRAGGGREG
ncbi:MAG: Hsp33 family molecular chaperone HslO [Firmicutes bacterium]|nr:Hsp33 family molecular chaperone HslO [Bacillota bacterium]